MVACVGDYGFVNCHPVMMGKTRATSPIYCTSPTGDYDLLDSRENDFGPNSGEGGRFHLDEKSVM